MRARIAGMRVAPLAFGCCCLLLTACEFSMSSTTAVSAGSPAPAGPSPSPMAGWLVQGTAHDAYAAEVDPEVPREGHPTIRFHPTRDPEGGYGTYMTSLDAAPVRGRRAHAIVWVRTQGVTSRGDVWLRAQGADSPADGPGLGYASAHLAPNADFTRYELFVDVPPEAARLQLGVGIAGPGMLWLDGVKIEAQ
jgi:hypothetical protein